MIKLLAVIALSCGSLFATAANATSVSPLDLPKGASVSSWTSDGLIQARRGGGSKSRGKRSSSRGHGGAALAGFGANETSSSCPCSGSKVCVGPRGGRYCITNGGNKRYGV